MSFKPDFQMIARERSYHYNDVKMGTIASKITSLTIVYSIVYSDADQRKHQSPASLAFVWGIHRGPVNYPHTWTVTRKFFPFNDVIMIRWHYSPYLYEGMVRLLMCFSLNPSEMTGEFVALKGAENSSKVRK